MEVIYPKACGIDVHKSFIVAVICDSTSVKPQYLRKRFSTFNNSLIEFRNWLLANDCQNVCMESTGKYYIPVYNALEGYISNVVVANPKWVKCIKGEKDDNKYAKWIAEALQCQSISIREKLPDLSEYDRIVFGSNVKAGKIAKLDYFRKNILPQNKQTVLFAVGVTPTDNPQAKALFKDNLTENKVKI